MGVQVATLVALLSLLTYLPGVTISRPLSKAPISLCRFTDEETFTCWWDPGDDGGLLANHMLWYSLEGEDVECECADYLSMGASSCFFDQAHTSLWDVYNISVVTTSPGGSACCLPVYIDIRYIVQPQALVNLQLRMDQEAAMMVTWSPSANRSAHSGWIGLRYQVRLKPMTGAAWECFDAGLDAQFVALGLRLVTDYLVQVRRCTLHGPWSDWSPTAEVRALDAPGTMRHCEWILGGILSCVTSLILIGIVGTKHKVRRCLLPPVPEPTIGGFNLTGLKLAGTGAWTVPRVRWQPGAVGAGGRGAATGGRSHLGGRGHTPTAP